MTRETRKRSAGFALLVALIFIFNALVLVTALSVRLLAAQRQTAYAEASDKCLYGLESALALSRAELESAQDGCVGIDAWLERNAAAANPGAPPAFGAEGVVPSRLRATPGVEFFACARKWSPNGPATSGRLEPKSPETVYCVRAFARCGGVVRSAEAMLRSVPQNSAPIRGITQLSWREVPLPRAVPGAGVETRAETGT